MKKKGQFRQLPPALIALIDVVLIGAALIVFALIDHAMPRALELSVSEQSKEMMHRLEEARAAQAKEEGEGIGSQFADKFTDGEPYWDGNTYTGRNLSVTLITGQKNTSVYYVQDIYLRDINCLQTAFGLDTYGKGYTEDAAYLSRRKNAVGAINGDFYYMGSLNVIVRNGQMYRDTIDPMESLLALFDDGTMQVYENGSFTVSELISKGVVQTWSFGPSLLDLNGKAVTEYSRKNPEANPRTVIGMVEPGHYMFIVVDGRQDGYSEGMTYLELAELCEELGLKIAYNLDGGGTSRMVMNGELISSPSERRDVSDIIYVVDTY